MSRRQLMLSAYPGVLDNATLVESNGLPRLSGSQRMPYAPPQWTRKGLRMAVLVLLRHGENEWNRKNLFAGWVDVDLTPAGEREARRAGDLLIKHDLLPDVLHTSLLRRAIRTAQITSPSPAASTAVPHTPKLRPRAGMPPMPPASTVRVIEAVTVPVHLAEMPSTTACPLAPGSALLS